MSTKQPTKADLEVMLAAQREEMEAMRKDPMLTLLEQMREDSARFRVEDAREQQDMEARFQSNQQAAEERMKILMEGLKGTPQTRHSPALATAALPKVNAKPPPHLEVDFSLTTFDLWKSAWNDYAKVIQVHKMSCERQLSLFRSNLSLDMISLLEHVIGIPEHTNLVPLTVQVLMDRIQAHIRGKRNIALDCVAFDNRKQKEGEDFDSYLVAIKNFARAAMLCDTCLDRRLATRIMSGIRDEETRTQLLALTPFPTLQAIIDLCRTEECVNQGNSDMRKSRIVNKASFKSERDQGRSPSQDH
eukprot:snap_masked-scaffold5505_size4578-processed-gene-0.0 protein:Tk10912 transcript:snap_masked-scaffold5505_size4578-processed-gene-0.0-mRNA-1 annotation:"hypothetical protein DAPPUDRAFT_258391"